MFNALGSTSPGVSFDSPSGLTGDRNSDGIPACPGVVGDESLLLMLSRLGGDIFKLSASDRVRYGLSLPPSGTACPGKRGMAVALGPLTACSR